MIFDFLMLGGLHQPFDGDLLKHVTSVEQYHTCQLSLFLLKKK